jgi:hypothetical protein
MTLVSTTTNQPPRQDWAAKTVFNLYFTDACTPNPYRVGVTDNDVMDKEQADYETGLSATVFPNPFTNEITLDMAGEGEAEIKLYNSIGKVVRTQAYSFGAVTLATDELKEGLYTLAVYQNGKRLVAKKVVK